MIDKTPKSAKKLGKLSPAIQKIIATSCSLIIGSLITLNTLPSRANELETLLSGQEIPLTLPLKNFDNSWRRISISGLAEMADMMKSWSGLLGTPTYNNVYYTQGKTVVIANKNYLVAYRIPMNAEPINFMALATQMLNPCEGQENSSPTITMETPVSLSLLNLETIGSLNDIKVFNINQEIADHRKNNQLFREMCEQKKRDEAKNEALSNLSMINNTQQAYFVENNGKFAQSMADLTVDVPIETNNYKYSMIVSDKTVFSYAIARNRDKMSYVGGVFVIPDSDENDQTLTITCISDKPGITMPNQPFLQENEPTCANGTTIAYW